MPGTRGRETAMAQNPLNGPSTGPMIEAGRYRVRFAADAADLGRARALRARLFRGDPAAPDGDAYDLPSRHLLVEDRTDGAVLGTCRLLGLSDGGRIAESYAAQFYDLARLGRYGGRMVEVGRFCVAPEARASDVLRLAWGAMTRLVEAEGIGLLFGCTSFHGTDAAAFLDAFALLAERHVAPPRWRPGVKAPDVVRLAGPHPRHPDERAAMKAMPPLLRSYLLMGGWVSDHAVRDRDLGTLHVFTGLEVDRVPATRRRLLRGLAGA